MLARICFQKLLCLELFGSWVRASHHHDLIRKFGALDDVRQVDEDTPLIDILQMRVNERERNLRSKARLTLSTWKSFRNNSVASLLAQVRRSLETNFLLYRIHKQMLKLQLSE